MPLMMPCMDDLATLLIAGRSESELRRTLGSRLTQLRQARGWRQRELATRAKIDPGRLSKLVRGVNQVTVAELVRLSLALGTGLDELVFGAAASLETTWQRLLQDLERAGGPQAIDFTSRWLQALVVCFRTGSTLEDSHGRR